MLDNVRVAENLQTQMRVDAVVRATAALIGLTLALTGCREHVAVAQVDPNGPVEVVIPERGAYTGAFMDFGDEEDDVTLETIEDFEQMVGKHQAIIASSSYWGEQNFPVDNLNVIWRHGSLPLVFWSPWDKPYEEDRAPDKFSLTEIVAGKWDAYIDKWADAARDYGQQYKDEPNPDIPSLVDWPYEEMCKLDPHKPIMIAEWATGEFPHSTEGGGLGKAKWIEEALKLFRTRYPRIKAALYWHERWQNADGFYSNLRVNSSVESLDAYRAGVAHPDWLGDLILRAIPKR